MGLLRVGMAQLNLRLGDLDGNAEMIRAAYDEAVELGARVVVFSELTVTGYPPEDLLLKPAFVKGAARVLAGIARHTGDVAAVVGFPEDSGRSGPVRLWNSAAMCSGGEVRGVFRKHLLPNYAVFDEQRYFIAGTDAGPLLQIDGVGVGVSVCEDLWGPPLTADAPAHDGGLPSAVGGPADASPALAQVAMGAQLLANLNGSPYRRGKQTDREAIARTRALGLGVPVVYVNQVGGQDELIFDGSSFVTDAVGEVVCRLAAFAEQVAVCDVEVGSGGAPSGPRRHTRTRDGAAGVLSARLEPLDEVWQALVTATRDYVRKNGFSDVVIGLSGGIDSSAVAAIATDALGPEHTHGVSMPSRYSSEGSRSDAADLARNLGIDFRTVPIESAHAALGSMLAGVAPEPEPRSADEAAAGLADQNIQSRIRGLMLMALSNRFGWLVLTTGNKTETSVGYTTLYGDTAGAYAVISDVPKLLVYELCEWRNRQPGGERIPRACITKPPSAELRPDQRDDQSLPTYELLDPIVEAYVEGDLTLAEAVEVGAKHGASAELVERVTRLVDIAEYKRRQSPPGPRISAKSFGKDRRMPITNLFR